MKSQNITVFYKWQAKEGQLENLKKMYEQVRQDMEQNEPGALLMHSYADEQNNELIVHDLFADADALGYHLGVTAASHFGALTEIANPGQFVFCGNVPQQMKDAATQMGLQAQFSEHVNGFEK